MQKTENVSIGRQPFVCDKDAYKIIEDYLAQARKNLKDDPEVDEIIADLESAMAEHLLELGKGLVINEAVAKKVVKQMGVVNTESSDTAISSI